jgi:protein-disulfide isomerase
MDLAYAVNAAAQQGKFREMGDRFFADQVQIEGMADDKTYIQKAAQDLRLDMKKFNADFQDKALQGVIQNDMALGDKLGVNATPTFYLDGKQLDNLAPADLLSLLKDLK